MINERDLKTIKGVLGNDEYKELTIRLVNDAILNSGTPITAPDIKRILKDIDNKLSEKKARVIMPDNKAE